MITFAMALMFTLQSPALKTKEWYICARSKSGTVVCDKKKRLAYKEANDLVKALNAEEISGFHFWMERPKHRRGK